MQDLCKDGKAVAKRRASLPGLQAGPDHRFFYTAFGPSQAEEVARTRRARWFDPALVDVFLAKVRAGSVWERMADPDLLRAVSRLEPADRVLAVTSERLDLTARAFARIIDAKSPFTYRHSERVAKTATAMAEHMALPTHAVRDQGRTGLLHDIGKLGVSNRILDKPGPLTHTEYAQVKKHPGLTYEVLTRVAPFRSIAEVAASHHEKLDGTGYHRGMTAEDLSVPSRILAVADVFDALSQDRPYRPAMPMEKVLAILDEESGEKLCPRCVGTLNELVSKGDL